MTTIPDHPIDCCGAVEYRMRPFDVINDNNILRGGPEAVKERLRGYRNGELLVKEYEYYKRQEACILCFWKLLFHSLPSKISGIGSEQLKTIFYYEFVGDRETIEEDNCMKRLVKQKTEPFSEWAYSMQEDEEDEKRCLIRFVCKTESGHRPKKQIFDRIFPEGAIVRSKLETKSSVVVEVLERAIEKEGKWMNEP
jgi:hypothetical protein